MPVVFTVKSFDISVHNIANYTTMIMHNVTARFRVRLAERSVRARKKSMRYFFNALLVNVSVSPVTVTDTSSFSAKHDADAIPFVNDLFPV